MALAPGKEERNETHDGNILTQRTSDKMSFLYMYFSGWRLYTRAGMSSKLSSLRESDFLLLSVQLAVERIVIALLNRVKEN